jgi:valyl-tRNA synthetase
VLLTALSDLEVQAQEEDGQLWHLRYPSSTAAPRGGATTRPETLLGDTAVAVTEDERHCVVGRRLRPLLAARTSRSRRQLRRPDWSGCVKITPAHDFNDHEVAQRHPCH